MRRETPLGLYKGLGAVLAGIIPKMAIRFTSFDWYKQALANKDGTVSSKATFVGRSPYGLKIGLEESPSKALDGLFPVRIFCCGLRIICESITVLIIPQQLVSQPV